MAHQVRLKVLGTRGLHNTSGVDYAIYGGNTTSIYITDGQRHFFIQAGFGINDMGDKIVQNSRLKQLPMHVLLSDFHWENTQGLPFFTPIHFKSSNIDVVVPSKPHDLDSKLQTVAGPAFTPFEGMSSLGSRPKITSFADIGSMDFGDWTLRAQTLASPLSKEPVIAYRLIHPGGFDMVYANPGALSEGTRQSLIDFSTGAKILLLGAFAPSKEIAPVHDGRMTFEEATELNKSLTTLDIYILGYAPFMTDAKLELSERLSENPIQGDLQLGGPTKKGKVYFCRDDQEIVLDHKMRTVAKAS